LADDEFFSMCLGVYDPDGSAIVHSCNYMHLFVCVSILLHFLHCNNNDNNNNNFRLVMGKTNRSTLHTVYNIQQSATQGSNDTTHRLSRRTAATTRYNLFIVISFSLFLLPCMSTTDVSE